MKCFLERYLSKEDADRDFQYLKDQGRNVHIEYRFNSIDEVDVWHLIINCAEEEYNLIKSDLQFKNSSL